ncbi:MAG: ABC transporter ATP-binding protein/permease [Pleurocapsa sp.]
MNRFNLQVFKRFWAIAKPYWVGNEKKGALSLLGLLFLLLLIYTPLSLLITRLQGNIISDLTRLDKEAFVKTIRLFLGVLIVYVPLYASFNYVENKLGNYWRKWLTHDFLNRYFSHRAFYELGNLNTEVDNPDQRISEDIKSFTVDSLSFLLVIVNSVFQMIGFTALLWVIPPRVLIFTLPQPISFSIFNLQVNITKLEPSILIIFLFVYAIIGTVITVVVFGNKLVGINYEQLRKEANFRFGLVRIRENSESIAFYRGERQESRNLKSIFQEVFANFNLLILWQDLLLPLFTNTYENIPYILPAVVVAPSVFSGDVEVGKVREAQIAFAQFFFAINVIVSRFQFLTAFVAGIDRLYFLREYLDRSESKQKTKIAANPIIETKINPDRLGLENLTLQTPNYQRTLVKNLTVKLGNGQGLLIMGASGCGKSSLLRAIAGLWNSGTGIIYRPPLGEMLFLPQKPYMILGTLRSQLIYPHAELQISDYALEQVLNQVNLPDLAERFGGFDVEKDWADVLSLGEQQRLAFARILINKPRYAILDEATSALDVNNESSLYNHLKQTQTTFISVGHRPTLVKYHQIVLEMLEGAEWKLRDPSTMF